LATVQARNRRNGRCFKRDGFHSAIYQEFFCFRLPKEHQSPNQGWIVRFDRLPLQNTKTNKKICEVPPTISCTATFILNRLSGLL